MRALVAGILLLGSLASACSAPSEGVLCSVFVQRYARLQHDHPGLSDLVYNKKFDTDPDNVLIDGIKDSIGLLECDENHMITEVKLEFKGMKIADAEKRREAMVNKHTASIGIMAAFSGDSWDKAKELMEKTGRAAGDMALSAAVDGKTSPSGDATVSLTGGYELWIAANEVGFLMEIDRPK